VTGLELELVDDVHCVAEMHVRRREAGQSASSAVCCRSLRSQSRASRGVRVPCLGSSFRLESRLVHGLVRELLVPELVVEHCDE